MSIGERRIGARSGNTAPAKNASHERQRGRGDAPTDTRRFATRTGIKPHAPQTALNATERLVLEVLDDELVLASEVAGFAGVSVVVCRRALATLRSLGLAEAVRRGQRNLWRRT